MSERIEIQTLTDGGQQPPDVAHQVAAFLAGATKTLDLAQYDFNLSGEAKDIVFHAELPQHAMDDRGGGLRRAGARQQSLRRERDAGDASAAVARRLADEEDARATV